MCLYACALVRSGVLHLDVGMCRAGDVGCGVSVYASVLQALIVLCDLFVCV